jgi:hypothetical protein
MHKENNSICNYAVSIVELCNLYGEIYVAYGLENFGNKIPVSKTKKRIVCMNEDTCNPCTNGCLISKYIPVCESASKPLVSFDVLLIKRLKR